mmetsp:Transcript_22987/g.53697  ORF Transcript_22987/g.53697 Transcript_22987/m.53697 type:complete len:538 (+) Transcript_22987:3-1616(+)
MVRLLLVLTCLVVAASAATVWPKPQSQTSSGSTLSIDQSTFTFSAVGFDSEILRDAFVRYLKLIFDDLGSGANSTSPDISGADVNVLTDDLTLSIDTNESYSLVVASPRIQLNATTVFGALRGLETLAQLTYRGVTIDETTINDFPRFSFRATMIDTSRHYYPVATILQHIDAMAWNKYNVLHWHLVDDVSFPYQSTTFPLLSQTGAFSPDHVYTKSDVALVVDYAMMRGIRVLPEFDTPGHVTKGWSAYPGLLTDCYDAHGQKTGTGPLDPTNDALYDFLAKFFAEIKEVFPDKFVHVGGDEVPFGCWDSNPAIQAWMKAHPTVKTGADLENYYERKLLQILQAQNTSYMCWQEIFDNGVEIFPDTVVDVWKGGSWNETLARVTKAGFHSVLSAPFYLNYISYGDDWVNYYRVEPLDFTCDGCNKSLVGGVEACMWSEYVDATNFISRMWPRASAVGERAWSSVNTTDSDEAAIRLHEFRCKLIGRGLQAEPMIDGGAPSTGAWQWCAKEWSPASWLTQSLMPALERMGVDINHVL